MKRAQLFLGRFQPLTANHVALIRQLLAEGERVVAGIFDTELGPDNPYTVEERQAMVRQAFGDTVEILVLPHVEYVCYGRNVGYGFRKMLLDVELPEISGTANRQAALKEDASEPSIEERAWVRTWNRVATRQWLDMCNRGFWPSNLSDRNDGEMIALIHSELTEVLECLRDGNPPDKNVPEFTGAEVQMADVIGRIMDMAAGRNWRVAEALLAKMRYNRTRPQKHGKAF